MRLLRNRVATFTDANTMTPLLHTSRQQPLVLYSWAVRIYCNRFENVTTSSSSASDRQSGICAHISTDWAV